MRLPQRPIEAHSTRPCLNFLTGSSGNPRTRRVARQSWARIRCRGYGITCVVARLVQPYGQSKDAPYQAPRGRLSPNTALQPTASRERSWLFDVISCSALAATERQSDPTTNGDFGMGTGAAHRDHFGHRDEPNPLEPIVVIIIIGIGHVFGSRPMALTQTLAEHGTPVGGCHLIDNRLLPGMFLGNPHLAGTRHHQ